MIEGVSRISTTESIIVSKGKPSQSDRYKNIQIGHIVQKTRRAHQDDTLVLDYALIFQMRKKQTFVAPDRIYLSVKGAPSQGDNYMNTHIGNRVHKTGRACQDDTSILDYALIFWISKKQTYVALNTTKTKYIAASQVSCAATWLQLLLAGLFDQVQEMTMMTIGSN